MLASADVIIVMSARQRRDVRWHAASSATVIVLGDLDPMWTEERTIVDPWNGEENLFRASYGRIERCVRVVADALTLSPEPRDRPHHVSAQRSDE
jgi:protein-tyrosine-phosphatase